MSEQMEDWGPGPYENPALAGVSDELLEKALRAIMPKGAAAPTICEPQHAVTEDGFCEWVCPKPTGYLMQCCDCDLIHEVEFRVAKYEPRPSQEFEVVDDTDMHAQLRMKRRDDLSQPEPTDDQIYRVADQWFKTGDNLLKPDGYYFRSLGTPANVRGSDLIAFARALLDGAASRVCHECAGHGRVYASQHSEPCPQCNVPDPTFLIESGTPLTAATQPTGRKD